MTDQFSEVVSGYVRSVSPRHFQVKMDELLQHIGMRDELAKKMWTEFRMAQRHVDVAQHLNDLCAALDKVDRVLVADDGTPIPVNIDDGENFYGPSWSITSYVMSGIVDYRSASIYTNANNRQTFGVYLYDKKSHTARKENWLGSWFVDMEVCKDWCIEWVRNGVEPTATSLEENGSKGDSR